MNRNGLADVGTVLTSRNSSRKQDFPRRTRRRMDYNVVLNCGIYYAQGIDDPGCYPSVTERNYCAILWAEPGREFSTHVAIGLPDPVWKENVRMLLQEPSDCRFLNLEIVRLNSKCDPGTSTGLVTVGRARIPLPNFFSKKISGRYGLVRFEDEGIKAEGHVILSLELHMINRSSHG